MRILVIGAVAAGTSAAAKARRNNEDAEITIYERESTISYSTCGMPYFLGGVVEDMSTLTPRDEAFFKSRYNIDVLTRHEVLALDPSQRTLTVKKLETGAEFTDHYDKLILATGARAVVPPFPGADKPHVFTLRNFRDMTKIASFIEAHTPKKVAIVGTGFIGLELAENFRHIGLDVTFVVRKTKLTPGFDPDLAVYIEEQLLDRGVRILYKTSIDEIRDGELLLNSGDTLEADMVILGTGVKPNVELAEAAGLTLGPTGAIAVNASLQTSAPDIYACGDCMEHKSVLTGKPVYRPLGTTANKTGRIAGDCVTGGTLAFRGILGTGICKVFDLTVAMTGLSETEAAAEGFDVQVCHNIKPAKAVYYGGKDIVIKAVADRKTGRVLGAQIVGEQGVDKRIDVLVTAITFGAKAEDLFHLDLAYAPPYATTKDPIMYIGMILNNAIRRGRKLITAEALDKLMASGEPYNLIDTRVPKQYETGHIDTAVSVPHENMRATSDTMDKNLATVTYCNKGVTGNATQNILLNKGFKKVFTISGGYQSFQKWKQLQK